MTLCDVVCDIAPAMFRTPWPLEAHLGSSDSTGMGLVMECVADAMGWISREENIGRGLTGLMNDNERLNLI